MRLTLSGRMVASSAPSAYLNVATCVTAVWLADGHVEHHPADEERHAPGASRPRPSSATKRPQQLARPTPAAVVVRRRPRPAAGRGTAATGRRAGRGWVATARRARGRADGAGGGTGGWCGRPRPGRPTTASRPPRVVGEQGHAAGRLGARPRRAGRRRPVRRAAGGTGGTGRGAGRPAGTAAVGRPAGCSGPGGYSRWSLTAHSGGSRKVGVHSATVRRRSRVRPVSGSPPVPRT